MKRNTEHPSKQQGTQNSVETTESSQHSVRANLDQKETLYTSKHHIYNEL